MYRLAALIRAFEDGAERLHTEGRLSGPFHSSAGQEAVAVGVCLALGRDDLISSTHRGHGHLIAKGGDPGRMLAELWGRADGYSGGRGGSMHLTDRSIGALGENGIVGGSMFLATGAALGFQHLGQPLVAVAFLGDGGVGQGVFHECLNLASIWQLPVLYVCENNGWAHSYPSADLSMGSHIAAFVEGYSIPAVKVDGTDVLAVHATATAAVRWIRDGHGPAFIEATCPRWRGHNLNDAQHLYRPREELEAARAVDPVVRIRELVTAKAGEQAAQDIEASVAGSFERALRFAESSPAVDPATVFEAVPA
jgi:TPP-dependent pyruvate/acetoin dehydrogenase alpha subunit